MARDISPAENHHRLWTDIRLAARKAKCRRAFVSDEASALMARLSQEIRTLEGKDAAAEDYARVERRIEALLIALERGGAPH